MLAKLSNYFSFFIFSFLSFPPDYTLLMICTILFSILLDELCKQLSAVSTKKGFW